MKNVLPASSLSSISNNHNNNNSGDNSWRMTGSHYLHHHPSAFRRMVPICEMDFESRIMLNSKLPKKRPLVDEMRKNDFVVDLDDYYTNAAAMAAANGRPILLKSLKTCFAADENTQNTSDGNCATTALNYDDTAAEAAYSNDLNGGDQQQQPSVHFSSALPFSTPQASISSKKMLANSLARGDDTYDYEALMADDSRIMRPSRRFRSAHRPANRVSDDDEDYMLLANQQQQQPHNLKSTYYLGSYNNANNFTNINNIKPPISVDNLDEQDDAAKKSYLQQANKNIGVNNNNSNNTNNNAHNRTYKYRVWQCKIYNFLERPRGWKSGIYHIVV